MRAALHSFTCAYCGKPNLSVEIGKKYCSRECYGKSCRGKRRPPFSGLTRQRISEAKTGQKRPPMSEESKRRCSESHAGKKRSPFTEEHRLHMSQAHKGKKRSPLSEETKRKLSEGRKGSKHWKWQGGATTEREKWVQSGGGEQWRKAVYRRARWICLLCKADGKSRSEGPRHAHHRAPFGKYPELRSVVENGVCLCDKHHNWLHSNDGCILRDTWEREAVSTLLLPTRDEA
jgi:hypothetical protein